MVVRWTRSTYSARSRSKWLKHYSKNPTIQYNQSTLVETADVSRDALLRRWDTLNETGLLEKVDAESKGDHWKLKQESEIANTLGRLIYQICNEEYILSKIQNSRQSHREIQRIRRTVLL